MRAQLIIALFEYLETNVFSVFSEELSKLEDHCPFFNILLHLLGRNTFFV